MKIKLEEIITGTSLTPSASENSFKVDEVGEFNLQGSENYREQALREQTSTHTISPMKSTV
jgi:hypothetical protein